MALIPMGASESALIIARRRMDVAVSRSESSRRMDAILPRPCGHREEAEALGQSARNSPVPDLT